MSARPETAYGRRGKNLGWGEECRVAGSKVLIKAGHAVTYDGKSVDVIRGITVAGTLAFATDKDTEVNVGLIRIEDRENYSEDGFECDAHLAKPDSNKPRPGAP